MKIRKNNQEVSKLLLDNAIETYTQFKDQYLLSQSQKKSLKSAIILLSGSVELFLKARLAKDHWTLIYKDLNKKLTEGSATVGLEDALQRLTSLDIIFKRYDVLIKLRNIRNRFEHSHFDGKDDLNLLIGGVNAFLDDFANNELDISLFSLIGDAWQTLAAKNVFETAWNNAEKKFTSLGDMTERYHCLHCNFQTVPIPDPESDNNHSKCYLCNSAFSIETCCKCQCPILWTGIKEDYPGEICDACFDDLLASED